jgi:hypothetical protein
MMCRCADSVTDLPDDAEDPDGPARRMVGPGDGCRHHRPRRAEQLGRFADEFVARLFDAGVTRATIRGVAAPETWSRCPRPR